MMPRTPAAWMCAAVLVFATGCSHFLETRAIEQFTAALGEEDLASLKAVSSERFEHKALRHDESIDDIGILNLPTGEVTITSVEDVDETHKKVNVAVGESKRKLQYDLVYNEKSGKWVIDDIQVRQRKEGLKVTRSVTEQMDLLLSVREFLAAWSKGGRNETLDATTPELRAILADLPAVQLARLTERVTDNKSSKFRPEAQLDGDVAVVRLPRSVGKLVLSLRLLDEGWRVDDLALESRSEKDHIPSLKKMAIAIRTAARFLTAYQAEDRKTLEKICSPRFYNSSLAPADFSMVKLPGAEAPSASATIKMQDRRADMLIPTEKDLVKISLVKKPEAEQDSEAAVEYLVEDVTLYELDGTQEKRISALFTSHAMLQLFHEALATGNLTMLRKTSTADFNRRVWDHLAEPMKGITTEEPLPRPELHDLPIAQLAAVPQIVGTTFQGALTEITVLHGEQRVVYQLRDAAGEVRIDDILLKSEKLPGSFKERAAWLVPVRNFAVTLQSAQVKQLPRLCSFEFNRSVWNQAEFVPPAGFAAAHHLLAPLAAIESTPERAMVTLGDEKFGAQVLLVSEHSQFVVDEVLLIAGSEPQQRARLKQELRNYFAKHGVRAPSGVVPASHEVPATAPPQTIDEPLMQDALPLPVGDPTGMLLLEPSDSAFVPPAEEPPQPYSRSVP